MHYVLGVSLVSVSLLPRLHWSESSHMGPAGKLRKVVFLCHQEEEIFKKEEKIKLVNLMNLYQILDFMDINAKAKSNLHKHKERYYKRESNY